MNKSLDGKKVAVFVADGFEQIEMEQPVAALDAAGATTQIISPEKGMVTGWVHAKKGDSFAVDIDLKDAKASDYDALLLPGGVMNPDKLRTLPDAVNCVKAFFEAGKTVAAICHGPQLLIEADVVAGRMITSYPSIKTDLINAGAGWVDQKVVVDHGLITSRSPADIRDFNLRMIEEFAECSQESKKAA